MQNASELKLGQGEKKSEVPTQQAKANESRKTNVYFEQ